MRILPNKSDRTGRLASARPRATQNPLREALKEFRPGSIALFSGAEDVVLIDSSANLAGPLMYFHRHRQTAQRNHEFFETIRKQYDQPIELLNPDPEVQNLVKAKGLFSFYEDGHQECRMSERSSPCARSWQLRCRITGQRQDQRHRSNVPLVNT